MCKVRKMLVCFVGRCCHFHQLRPYNCWWWHRYCRWFKCKRWLGAHQSWFDSMIHVFLPKFSKIIQMYLIGLYIWYTLLKKAIVWSEDNLVMLWHKRFCLVMLFCMVMPSECWKIKFSWFLMPKPNYSTTFNEFWLQWILVI